MCQGRTGQEPTQSPQAWAGAKCTSVEGQGFYVVSMESKWNKANNIINPILTGGI